MRTILVNPRRRRRHRRRNASLFAANPRMGIVTYKRRKRHVARRHHRRANNPTFYMANPRRRRRYRRNALILPNRRRYRRNASFNIRGAFNTILMGAIGGGGAYALNKFVIAKIMLGADGNYTSDNALYWHIAARAVASAIAGFFLPSTVASAANGALAYASIDEIIEHRNYLAARAQGADLSGLEADLSDVLDGL